MWHWKHWYSYLILSVCHIHGQMKTMILSNCWNLTSRAEPLNDTVHSNPTFIVFKPLQIQMCCKVVFLSILILNLGVDCIYFPCFHQVVQLQTLGHGSYHLVFNYLRQAWSESFKLISDVVLATMCSRVSFLGAIKWFAHVWVSKCHYGAGEYSCGKSAQYAYIDTWVPILVDYIFQVSVTHGSNKHTLAFVVIWKFMTDTSTLRMDFPWSFWYNVCSSQGCCWHHSGQLI